MGKKYKSVYDFEKQFKKSDRKIKQKQTKDKGRNSQYEENG